MLNGEKTERPPIWLMRQAGRYLPEYHVLRERAGSFLGLCYTPALATEVTLQPIRRFGLDAAILFSDILVIPDALGQSVDYVEGEGPRLEPIEDERGLRRLRGQPDPARLAPVFETVSRVRSLLDPGTALIGFCGGPWTVANYMVAGRGTPDLRLVRLAAYQDPEFLGNLVDRLVEASSAYLTAQIEAGADAVQIFESVAGALPPQLFERWCLDPIRRIVTAVRREKPGVKVIVFARGAGLNLLKLAESGVADAVGLDWSVDLDWARKNVQCLRPTQGNLDPVALVAGGAALDDATDGILASLGQGPHIFNLGHGILPETPIENVERLVARVQGR